MINIKRIHTFGCSFTAGDELIDHIIFSSLGTMQEVDEFKYMYGSKFEEQFKYNILPEWKNEYGAIDYPRKCQEQKKFAWPAILGKLLNTPMINHAEPGSSNELIFLTLEKELAAGNIRADDLVIIGLTSPNRLSYFNPYKEDKLETYHPFSDGQSRFSKSFTREYLETVMTKKFMMWKFHEAKMKCDMLNRSYIKNRVLFLETIHSSEFYYQMYCDENEDKSFLEHIKWFDDKFKNRLAACFGNIMDFRAPDSTPNYAGYHGRFHPKVELHQQVAESIRQELLTKFKFGN